MSKHSRQHRIAALLEAHPVSSQVQLVDLLEKEDLGATQATVSRDLEEMGAVKVRIANGDSVYAIPENPSERVAPQDYLRRIISNWVVTVASSGNLVVLGTPPGSAHVVGSALDRASLPDVIGTVAGDDTVLVIASEGVKGSELGNRFRELAGL